MEKIISPEERLRRAEEIYCRRKAQGVRVTTASVNVGKSNKVSLGRKMLIQILICVCIYLAFWLIKGYDNVFSESVINNTKNILNYDINFQNLYNQCMEYFNNNFNSILNIRSDFDDESIDENNGVTGKEENDTIDENKGESGNQEPEDNKEQLENNSEGEHQKTENSTQDIAQDGVQNDVRDSNQDVEQIEDETATNEDNPGIGGGSDSSQNISNDGTIKAKADAENQTQMQQDAEYIKQNCNIIKPLEGYITSNFGSREENEIVSAFHQGVDIGAVTRNSNTCCNGRNGCCFIICGRLWQSYKNSKWRNSDCICTL